VGIARMSMLLLVLLCDSLMQFVFITWFLSKISVSGTSKPSHAKREYLKHERGPRWSRLPSDPLQYDLDDYNDPAIASTEELPIFIIGGSDGSGTWALVDAFRNLGVRVATDDKVTFDVHGAMMQGKRLANASKSSIECRTLCELRVG
jgi:hypothetical protein